jgi:hypothetical protein
VAKLSRTTAFGTEQKNRASFERLRRATWKAVFFVSFLRAFPKLFPCLSPSAFRGRSLLGPSCSDCRESSRIPQSLPASGPLSTDRIGHILHVVDLCRPVLRLAWFGPERLPRGRCRALREAGPSTHRVRRGRHVLLANAPRIQSASIVLSTILPQRGATISQHLPLPGAGSITRWFTLRQPFSWRQPFLPFRQPLAPAREVAYWHPVMQRRQRVRPDSNDRFS